MYSIPFSKKNINNLACNEWQKLQDIAKEPASILIYDEDNELDPSKILAFGASLNTHGLADMRLHVYHKCQEDAVEIRDSYNDVIKNREVCPACKKPLRKVNTSYNIELIIKYPIILT